jgi:hypothetical protein
MKKETYSDKEKMLFERLGLSYLLESESIEPLVAYRTAAIKCFIDGAELGKSPFDYQDVESLRRCCYVFENSLTIPIKRLTREWDDMIKIDVSDLIDWRYRNSPETNKSPTA